MGFEREFKMREEASRYELVSQDDLLSEGRDDFFSVLLEQMKLPENRQRFHTCVEKSVKADKNFNDAKESQMSQKQKLKAYQKAVKKHEESATKIMASLHDFVMCSITRRQDCEVTYDSESELV